jgi:hypothetical protein
MCMNMNTWKKLGNIRNAESVGSINHFNLIRFIAKKNEL